MADISNYYCFFGKACGRALRVTVVHGKGGASKQARRELIVEFIREPDPQLGYLFHTGWLTMGQVQSIPLVIVGLVLLAMSRRAPVAQANVAEATTAGA